MNNKLYIILMDIACVSGICAIIYVLTNPSFHYNGLPNVILYGLLILYLLVVVGTMIMGIIKCVRKKKMHKSRLS